ncbi:hypothetical protein FFLO_06426 [Filobasidium floriforme]|uniref:Uncharacterized protein n=1 Tax=Filobasidium floriforme TaxID=5210 RepID=A0A8K0JFE7_9TREE|nr:uncharacterized protein HD553DRAFT_201928 [Filobasidium floriforme]KAG7528090.1 hypothetical protein FFLO_06426 [Filobasidium floriforme]KAH8086785.1 hypothetical protein HD553DRAFT_201928 [Filobasidium floriforme]
MVAETPISNADGIRRWARSVAALGRGGKSTNITENQDTGSSSDESNIKRPEDLRRRPIPPLSDISSQSLTSPDPSDSIVQDKNALNSDFDDSDLDPSDSMSQLGEFNKELVPSAIEPPANRSDITAGDGTPGYYQFRLQAAEVVPFQKCMHEHFYLYDIFGNVATLRDIAEKRDGWAEAVTSLKTLATQRITLVWPEQKLDGKMQVVLENWLNPKPNDLPVAYVVTKPGIWNRIPANITHCQDLSQPDSDMTINIDPKHPNLHELMRKFDYYDFEWDPSSGDHPLSARAMLRIVLDKLTKEKAPLKSTKNYPGFPLLWELLLAEFKVTGSLAHKDRSPEMKVARNQTENAMFVQLATFAQLYMDVPLEGDKDFERFVLSMTICGEFWTVEYAFRMSARATRHETRCSTIAKGNWAEDPKAFLGAIQQVMEENMRNVADAARRMEVLMNTAKKLPTKIPKFEIPARGYTKTPKPAEGQEVKKPEQAEERGGKMGEQAATGIAIKQPQDAKAESVDEAEQSGKEKNKTKQAMQQTGKTAQMDTTEKTIAEEMLSQSEGAVISERATTPPAIYVGDEPLQAPGTSPEVSLLMMRRKVLAAHYANSRNRV